MQINLSSLILASKSTTSQEDWHQIMLGNTSKITPTETEEIVRNGGLSNRISAREFELLLRLRLNASYANHFIDISRKFDGSGDGYKALVSSCNGIANENTTFM